MNREPKKQPDYPKAFDLLIAAGVTQAQLGEAMGITMTDRMLRYYRAGTPPLPQRAAGLDRLWAKVMGKKRFPLKTPAGAAA